MYEEAFTKCGEGFCFLLYSIKNLFKRLLKEVGINDSLLHI
ncbi:hypothetical protein B4144_2880 [Bacillus atrophaeus]|nr:hypothetical protein B4144_2880 [Bacillus atrophaeus]